MLEKAIFACRLMNFDLDNLYELHYQMITLGKVRTPVLFHEVQL